MNKQLLLQNADKKTVEVLKYLRDNPGKEIKISDWQKNCGTGFGSAFRIFDLLVSAGIISERKYKMPVGKDGKRHREYLPHRLLVALEELDILIKSLEEN